jgi:hypothetical protein
MKVPTWITALAALVSLAAPPPALAAVAGVAIDKVPTTRVCSQRTGLCYSEYMTSQKVAYRIALPQTATSGQAFDVALQIVAPRNTGWAAISWGGSMVNNPLTVGWPNGNNVTVSPRWTAVYRQPTPYTGETLTLLPDHGVNATHWTLSVLCQGCSVWNTNSYLNPSATVWIATAINLGPAGPNSVARASDPSSAFQVHDWSARFGFDMSAAKQANFATVTAQYKPKSATEPLAAAPPPSRIVR